MEKKSGKSRGIILDSFALTGQNLWGIIKIVVVFYIFLSLVSAGMLYGGLGIANKNSSILPAMSIIVVVSIAVIGALVQSFTDAAAIKLVYESTKGNKITMRKAIKEAFKKGWRIIGAAIFVAIISGVAGFLAIFIMTLISSYMGSDGYAFSVILTTVIGGISALLTSFIIPAIMIDDLKVFAAFKETLVLLGTAGGQVILKVLGLMIVAFIVISISYLITIIPHLEIIGGYIVIFIGQIALVFIEVGKVVLFKDYAK
ncbi:MAG: hypothetical protein ACRCTZ_02125 [Sarcina sp.]